MAFDTLVTKISAEYAGTCGLCARPAMHVFLHGNESRRRCAEHAAGVNSWEDLLQQDRLLHGSSSSLHPNT